MSDLVWEKPRRSGAPWIGSIDGRVEYKIVETADGTFKLSGPNTRGLREYLTPERAMQVIEDHQRSAEQWQAHKRAEEAVAAALKACGKTEGFEVTGCRYWR